MRIINQLSLTNFRIWDYSIFPYALGYIYIEHTNSLLAVYLQVVPKVPNSAIALIICYLTIPSYIRNVSLPFNPIRWTLPFLIIATISLPLIQYEQYQSTIELTAAWFWVLFLTPLMIRVLATPSGRWHFAVFSIIGLVSLCLMYYSMFFIFDQSIDDVQISYHHVSGKAIAIFPILIGYIYIKRGLTKVLLIIALIIVITVVAPIGARSIWLILPIEVLLLALFILPKSRSLIIGVVVSLVLFLFSSFYDISKLYPDNVMTQFENRKGKVENWQDDATVWKRMAMVLKTKKILEKYPIFGVGYSNKSFASFDGGWVDFLGHRTKVGRIDAHNTYLNILGGTGIFGFLAFLYYLRKVLLVFRSIPKRLIRYLDCGPFLIALIGVLTNYLFSNVPFSSIVTSTSIVFALFVYYYNMEVINPPAGVGH